MAGGPGRVAPWEDPARFMELEKRVVEDKVVWVGKTG